MDDKPKMDTLEKVIWIALGIAVVACVASIPLVISL